MEDTWFCRGVRERERSMFRLAWAMLRNEADCEDAVQSAILKAYEALPALRDKNAFGSWLLRILQRECLQLLKKRPQTLPLEEVPEPSWEDVPGNGDLRAALDRLSPKEQGALVLFYYEDMSVRDIARLMDAPAGTMRSWLARGRSHLKDLLQGKEKLYEL